MKYKEGEKFEIQQRKNVMLNESRIRKLKFYIGGGNLSEGIRIACDAYNVKK